MILFNPSDHIELIDQIVAESMKVEEGSIYRTTKFKNSANANYKYSDRYDKLGFTFRNLGNIFKNMTINTKQDYSGIHPQLLKMVDSCKTLDELSYLRRDINVGKTQLKLIAEKDPSRKKAIDDHLEWLNTVYKDAINKKAKELRNK